MIIDRFRELTCPECGEDHEIDIINITGFQCTCGTNLIVEQDELDFQFCYRLVKLEDEQLYKWEPLTNEYQVIDLKFEEK